MLQRYIENFKHKSLSTQISTSVVLTIGILGAILSALVCLDQYQHGLKELHERTRSVAAVVAHNVGAAVEFQDTTAAKEILSSALLVKDIHKAQILLNSGEIFVELINDAELTFIDRTITPHTLSIPITSNSESLGRVVLHATHHGFYFELAYESVGAITLLLTLAYASYLFSLYFIKIATTPIYTLIDVTHQIASEKDFSLRLEPIETGEDLKELYVSFNKMIGEVAKRDQSLKNMANSLEQLVEERTEALAETVRSLEFTQQAIEKSHELVLWWNEGGSLQYANQSAKTMLHNNSSESTDIYIWDIDNDISKESWPQFWKSSSSPAENLQMETRFCNADGSTIPIQYSMNRVTSSDIEYLCIIARDVTELKAKERQLLQGQKLESIGHLAAGIAHEINTPTQFIGDNIRFLETSFLDLRTYLQKLEQLTEGKETTIIELKNEFDIEYLLAEVPEAVEQSVEGINRVAKIVTAMKEFAHPGVEEKILFDLNEALKNSVEVSRNEWKYCAEVEYKLADDLQDILCYPGDLNQVFLNLIINASHAIQSKSETNETNETNETKSDGKIVIETQNVDSGVCIKITDNGCGIDASMVERIFDPFFTTKAVGKGTGQGLAISHSIIVEKHNGGIQVQSQPGKGTTFEIVLPQNG